MMKHTVLELVNKDTALLALFSGMLIDSILLIALMFYVISLLI